MHNQNNEAGNLLPQEGTPGVPVRLIRAVAHVREAYHLVNEESVDLADLRPRDREILASTMNDAVDRLSEVDTIVCDMTVTIQIKRLGGQTL